MLSTKTDPFGREPPLITPENIREWLVHEDEHLVVFNKPGWVVCHPSKNGPWSSLAGACREYFQCDKLHLVSRLDRETSGAVIIARDAPTARIWQMAIQERRVRKDYWAVLTGEMSEEAHVIRRLAKDLESQIHVKVCVRRSHSSKRAETIFNPVLWRNGYTLCRIELVTGRKHQIRAHAEWLGHPVAGDKMYGPDETCYLEFIEHGWTDRMATVLPIKRQALHAARLTLTDKEGSAGPSFFAPFTEDLLDLCRDKLDLDAEEVNALIR